MRKAIGTFVSFLDSQGLLRVGGRLRHSDMTDNEKHPIILPKSHHVTDMIIDYYHQKYLHAGPHLLQSLVMKQFWILSARSAIRSIIFKCMTCFRCKPRFSAPVMGDLPASRLKSVRAFETCGTDYAGPFTVKIHKLKRVQPIKVYLCLFICFSTKAIHIEIVTDLTSDAFIGALTRFVSRRGLPSHIYSDCGTNYIGAASQIRRLMKDFLQEDATQRSIQHFSSQNSIMFHFSPAKAPNFGGLWERSVQSIKYHLRRVIGTQILTLEEFTTLCTNVEAILNSRPLTELSADPAEVDVLTPGHFLIGTALTSLPQRNHLDTNVNRLRRWHMIQAFTQHIWKRWKAEYLHTLQSRSKWTSQKKPLQEGRLVVVHDDNAPPLLESCTDHFIDPREGWNSTCGSSEDEERDAYSTCQQSVSSPHPRLDSVATAQPNDLFCSFLSFYFDLGSGQGRRYVTYLVTRMFYFHFSVLKRFHFKYLT